MKVEFDNWETCYTGTAFVLEMEFAPRVGEELLIHKSLFPASYYEEPYDISPMEEAHDGLIRAEAKIVQHVITADGHMVRVCIDV